MMKNRATNCFKNELSSKEAGRNDQNPNRITKNYSKMLKKKKKKIRIFLVIRIAPSQTQK